MAFKRILQSVSRGNLSSSGQLCLIVRACMSCTLNLTAIDTCRKVGLHEHCFVFIGVVLLWFSGVLFVQGLSSLDQFTYVYTVPGRRSWKLEITVIDTATTLISPCVLPPVGYLLSCLPAISDLTTRWSQW